MSKKVLVAYFSASNVTANAAKQLANDINGDIFEIKPVKPYSIADLDWNNSKSRSSLEMKDESSRPDIVDSIDVSSYDVICLGFPVWWDMEPRVVDTFLDGVKITNQKVVVFATSGGSGINGSYRHLCQTYPNITFIKGEIVHRKSSKHLLETIKNA